uniref:Spore cortex-lytic enzyme n=1 Tax=Podoviridae sp. ctoqT5 TaxID=2826577 RepID=A0A8S5MPU6_9CAUD|nr:MAG TPA: spore cortex-lytic enzyme [Podoviridae sp. ctoqT5]
MASTIYRQGQASSTDVREMQKALKDQGYYKGNVDGVWGNQTSSALSNYKRDTGGSNTAGNSFGRETIVKLFGNPLPGSSGSSTSRGSSSGGGSSSSSSSNRGNSTGSLTKGVLGMVSNIAKNPTQASQAYLKYLQSGGNPIGSENLVADPNIKQQWDDALAASQQYYDTGIGQLGNIYSSGAKQANLNADDMARQQYILYKQNKNRLAEQLSTNGITGGASETALNSILNAYSSNLSQNEAARQAALASLRNEYQSGMSDLLGQLQQNQANINSQYGQLQREDLANQREQLAEAQRSAFESYLENKSLNNTSNWNARVSANIQAKNPRFVYTDNNGRLHYTNSQTTAATAKAQGYTVVDRTSYDKKKSSGKSNNSKSSNSIPSSTKNSNEIDMSVWGGSTPTNSKQSNYNDVYRNAAAWRQQKDGQTKTVDYISKMVSNGTITESEAKRMLKALGL